MSCMPNGEERFGHEAFMTRMGKSLVLFVIGFHLLAFVADPTASRLLGPAAF
jgi:hypothetical protein